MSKKSAAPKAEETPEKRELNDKAVAFLTQECERMLSLYNQAQSNAQNVFNFYLTFTTTVVGAVIVLLQVSPARVELLVGTVLFFSFIVGTIYISSLSGKYGHASRYAHVVDEIRRYLIENLDIPTPTVYAPFLAPKPTHVELEPRWVWLFPAGTYQFFIALVTSTALAGITWLIFADARAGIGRGLLASVIVFILALTIYNAYSRLVVRKFYERLHVRVDTGKDLAVWAARE